MYVVFILIGVALAILGAFIHRYKLVQLIAGYDPKKTADPEGLARWAGTNLLLMGTITAVAAAVSEYLALPLQYVFFIFIAAVLLISVRTVNGCKRYEK
jgi:hypothetical protein